MPQHLAVVKNGKRYKLFSEDILYLEGMGNDTKIFTRRGEIFTAPGSIGMVTERLPFPIMSFNRSYSGNYDCIESYTAEEVWFYKKIIEAMPANIRADVKIKLPINDVAYKFILSQEIPRITARQLLLPLKY